MTQSALNQSLYFLVRKYYFWFAINLTSAMKVKGLYWLTRIWVVFLTSVIVFVNFLSLLLLVCERLLFFSTSVGWCGKAIVFFVLVLDLDLLHTSSSYIYQWKRECWIHSSQVITNILPDFLCIWPTNKGQKQINRTMSSFPEKYSFRAVGDHLDTSKQERRVDGKCL